MTDVLGGDLRSFHGDFVGRVLTRDDWTTTLCEQRAFGTAT